MKRNLPLSQVFSFLEPGPVIMITTSLKGKPNIMTMAWHTMIDFEPPLIGIVMGEEDFSFEILKATRECVINIPAVNLARKAAGCGSTTGRNVDKFRKFGLTPAAAKKVSAPLIDECFVNIECKVVDTRLVRKYNFFVLEGVQAWRDPAQKNPKTFHHHGKGIFEVSGKFIKLPIRPPSR